MLSWLTNKVHRQHVRRFSENARAWYQNCQLISRTCGDALYNTDIDNIDTRSILSNVDSMLWSALQGQTSSVRRILRRRNPGLAQRVNQTSGKVIELRNQTFSFLVRFQGPVDFLGNGSHEAAVRQMNYYRALDRVGFAARQSVVEVDRELESIWREMDELITQVEQHHAV